MGSSLTVRAVPLPVVARMSPSYQRSLPTKQTCSMSVWSALGAVGVMRTGPGTLSAMVCQGPPQLAACCTVNTPLGLRCTSTALLPVVGAPADVVR